MNSTNPEIEEINEQLRNLSQQAAALRARRTRLRQKDRPPGKANPGPAVTPTAGGKKRMSFVQKQLAIARAIEANGPTGAAKLSAECKIDRKSIYLYLHTNWFVNDRRKWDLTDHGRESSRIHSF